jgi:hypothetical protein
LVRNCGSAPVDVSQVWISAKLLNYYETNGLVVRVSVRDSRHAVVTLRSEGEGTTFTAKKGLTLSPDRMDLIIRDEDDTGQMSFHRCSSK